MHSVLFGHLLCFLLQGSSVAQPGESAKKVIVSVKHPVDSLGETVYEFQGVDEVDRPVVPGVLTNPPALNQPKPKYSKALKAERFDGKATITAVISAQGKVIDPETDPTDDPEAARCALEAVQRYRFNPPLLDGRPVAERFKVEVHFALTRP